MPRFGLTPAGAAFAPWLGRLRALWLSIKITISTWQISVIFIEYGLYAGHRVGIVIALSFEHDTKYQESHTRALSGRLGILASHAILQWTGTKRAEDWRRQKPD